MIGNFNLTDDLELLDNEQHLEERLERACGLTLIHDTENIERISDLSKMGILFREVVILGGHINHHRAFAGDLDVP